MPFRNWQGAIEGKIMPLTPMLIELGTGMALRAGHFTSVACRALRDALWHNSIILAEFFNANKEDMIIEFEIAC